MFLIHGTIIKCFDQNVIARREQFILTADILYLKKVITYIHRGHSTLICLSLQILIGALCNNPIIV